VILRQTLLAASAGSPSGFAGRTAGLAAVSRPKALRWRCSGGDGAILGIAGAPSRGVPAPPGRGIDVPASCSAASDLEDGLPDADCAAAAGAVGLGLLGRDSWKMELGLDFCCGGCVAAAAAAAGSVAIASCCCAADCA